jgi:hypothetical protein
MFERREADNYNPVEHWLMKGCIPRTNEEAIYEDVNVDDDVKSTLVEMTSRKGNYSKHDVYLEEIVDCRGMSTDNLIYLIDLYPEYKPRHFQGSCWTRGSWMCIVLEDDDFVAKDPWDKCFDRQE